MNSEIEKYLIDLQDKTAYSYFHKNSPDKKIALVIIEPRNDLMLPYVIAAFCRYLPYANLYVFHSEDNYMLLKNSILSSYENIYYKCMSTKNITVNQYSQLLKTVDFWNLINEEIILIFQLDTVAFRHPSEKFFNFPFIGAVCGPNGSIMNGGLSIRHKSAMIKMIEENQERIGKKSNEAEDIFFTETLRASKEYKNKLPSQKECHEFSYESGPIQFYTPFGAHGTNKGWLDSNGWKQLLRTSRY
jgi:hypothetical protein